MKNNYKDVSDVVGDIYEACLEPSYWSTTLANMCRLLDAKSAGIFVKDYKTNTIKIESTYGFPKAVQSIYNLGLGKIDPSYKRMAALPVGISKNMLNLEYPEQPIFQKLVIRPAGIGYAAAMNVIDDKDDCYVGIAFHRSPKSKTFEKEALALIQSFFPHLRRSLKIQREFLRLQLREHVLSESLSKLPYGIVIIDKKGQTEYTNHIAQRVLKHHPAISLQSNSTTNSIIATQHEQNIILQNAITECATAREGNSPKVVKNIGLTHPNSESPLAVMLMSLHEKELQQSNDTSSAKVFLVITDYEFSLPSSPDALREVFSLTPNEAELAVALANGFTLEQIAERNNIKLGTVRSQLKVIFSKMGVSRQQYLIRLVLTGPYSFRDL